MAAIERLSAEDRIMLWPDERWPQDIGALLILDGAPLLDDGDRLRIEAVRAVVAERLHLVPRFRQLLCIPPRHLDGPLWIDAPHFDIAKHIRVMSLDPPADEATLLLAVEALRRRRLDRSRPLWEMTFLTGLPRGRVALVVRMHHCTGDGIAGIATTAAFLDTVAETPHEAAPPWSPSPPPSVRDLRVDVAEQRRAERLRRIQGTLHPASSVTRLRAAWPGFRELVSGEPPPHTSLDRIVGPSRTFAVVRGSLDSVKRTAHAASATVNDVLLSAIAAGLRSHLRSHGENVDGLRLPVYVPVSLRQGHYAGARGNEIAQMVVPLPLGIADPDERLRVIAERTARLKRLLRPSVGSLPQGGISGRAFLALMGRRRVNVTTADLPGPPVPLYLVGAEVLEVFPILPLIGWVSLGVGALSYAGQFNILVVADRDAVPDATAFTDGLREVMPALQPLPRQPVTLVGPAG